MFFFHVFENVIILVKYKLLTYCYAEVYEIIDLL